ncbi:MAG TPA: hypothetical protein VE244_12300 [Nitrososphaeraceae archaeon]|jgi:3-mercaptopyruvate sulfurtransferase SseA|nr:hypothetical protein [Nitrososphaeraceae archaeon]
MSSRKAKNTKLSLPVDESRDHIQVPVTGSWAEWANTVENPIEK